MGDGRWEGKGKADGGRQLTALLSALKLEVLPARPPACLSFGSSTCQCRQVPMCAAICIPPELYTVLTGI